MLREKLYDAGEIVETILTQPLSIPGLQKNISLLEASKDVYKRQTTIF